jgi:hypothetical protein
MHKYTVILTGPKDCIESFLQEIQKHGGIYGYLQKRLQVHGVAVESEEATRMTSLLDGQRVVIDFDTKEDVHVGFFRFIADIYPYLRIVALLMDTEGVSYPLTVYRSDDNEEDIED